MKVRSRGVHMVVAALALGSLAGAATAMAARDEVPAPTRGEDAGARSASVESMDAFAGVDVALTECAAAPKTSVSVPEVLGLKLPGLKFRGLAVLDGWTCGGGSTPFLRLVDHPSVVVSYESGWSGVDVEAKWEGFVRDVNPAAEVVDIDGVSSLIDPAVTEDGRSQVMVVVGDILVRVSGESDVANAELVATARDLDVLGHHVADRRLIGGRPPSAVWRR